MLETIKGAEEAAPKAEGDETPQIPNPARRELEDWMLASVDLTGFAQIDEAYEDYNPKQ